MAQPIAAIAMDDVDRSSFAWMARDSARRIHNSASRRGSSPLPPEIWRRAEALRPRSAVPRSHSTHQVSADSTQPAEQSIGLATCHEGEPCMWTWM